MKHDYKIIDGDMSISPLEENHLEFVRKWRNQDNIRTCFINQVIITEEQQLKWYSNYLNTNDVMFVIEWKNQPVGAVALYNIVGNTAEFGRLMIGESIARGHGLGKRATKSVCDFGFETLGLKEIRFEVLNSFTESVEKFT